jgi:hypothetical protein
MGGKTLKFRSFFTIEIIIQDKESERMIRTFAQKLLVKSHIKSWYKNLEIKKTYFQPRDVKIHQ